MLRFSSSLLLLVAGAAQAFGAVDSDLLALLPSGTQTVAGMDVKSSRASSFGQFMLQQMSSNDKQFAQMIEQTGFDPRRDLQSFVIGTAPGTKAGSSFVMVARGVFDQQRITARAVAKGLVSQSVAGTTILASPASEGRPVALTFLDTGLAAFGDRASVEQTIRNRTNPSMLSTDLQKQVSAAGGNDAWFASTLSANELASHVPAPMGKSDQAAQAMQGVTQSNGGIRFGSTVQLSFNALTRSDQDATSLTDVIRFVSSAIQMQRQNDPRAALLAPSIDSLKLRADGRYVYTSLEIPEADLEQIVASQHSGRTGKVR